MNQHTEKTATEPRDSRPDGNHASFGIPVAIVIGFGLIAAAIFFSGGGLSGLTNNDSAQLTNETEQQQDEPATSNGSIPPVTEDDYIRGNPNASIVLVEYSDYDCPFCKRFHDTMNQVIEKYGPSGDVAWVYRHMPLQQLHPNAPQIAHAAECVGDLGGNEAFWTFTDLIFNERGTNDPTNMTQLPSFAVEAGVSETELNECMESRRFEEKITGQLEDAFNAGAEGTPHTFVLVGDQQGAINGARPFGDVDQIISNLLTQIGGAAPGGTSPNTAPADQPDTPEPSNGPTIETTPSE